VGSIARLQVGLQMCERSAASLRLSGGSTAGASLSFYAGRSLSLPAQFFVSSFLFSTN